MKRTRFDLMVFMIPEFFERMIRIPEIQRQNTAWSLRQKQNLIDSLYNDFDVPKIYLRKRDGDSLWWLLDGQQRLTSVRDFLADTFELASAPTLPNHLHGKKFSQLEFADRDRITKRALDCIIIECNEDEEEDMFVRLNNGTPLSASEKRNAIKGDFRRMVKQLTEHRFFIEKKYSFTDKRLSLDVFCAQLCALAIDRNLAPDPARLNQLYKTHKKFDEAKKVTEQVTSILNYWDSLFDRRYSFLKKNYLLVMFHVSLTRGVLGKPDDVRKRLIEFEAKRAANRKLIRNGLGFDASLTTFEEKMGKCAATPQAMFEASGFFNRMIDG